MAIVESSETVQCGSCGTTLALAQADVAADGYRCFSCSTDDKLRADAEENARDAARDHAAIAWRIPFLCGPLAIGAIWYGTGRVRVGGALALVALALFSWRLAKKS